MHTNKTRGEILRSTSKKKKRRKEDEHETPESHQHTKSTEPRSKVKSFHAEPWRRCTQKIIRCSLELSHHAEDGIVAADGRAVLFVLGLGVADLVVLGRGCNEAASNPHRVALQLVAHHLHVNLLGLLARDGLATLEAVVDMALDLLLQALLQVLEHRRASREHNVRVQAATNVDGALLHNIVDQVRQRRLVVWVAELRVEEDLGAKETLVAHINSKLLLRDGVARLELLEPRARLLVVLLDLFVDVLANVAVSLLDLLGNLNDLSGRNVLVALAEEVHHKPGDVAASNGDVLDLAADDVALSDRNDVGDTIARVDDRAGESARALGARVPRGCERKHCLHRNVQPGNIEGLEHDLGGVLAVLRGVERGLCQQHMVL
eukprot:m.491971 g.491971  ORF g.491971 m.491971 type:complete len:377 (+) comp57273_c0_seq9:45-1175(+)